jgi:hypothetical protein
MWKKSYKIQKNFIIKDGSKSNYILSIFFIIPKYNLSYKIIKINLFLILINKY